MYLCPGEAAGPVFFHSGKCLHVVSFPTSGTTSRKNSHCDMNVITFLTAGFGHRCVRNKMKSFSFPTVDYSGKKIQYID